MTNESLSATVTMEAPAEKVIEILAGPSSHAAIDGTGWVCGPLDGQPLTASEQIFRMTMYHLSHPKGNYEMANLVQKFDPPRAITWKPGYDPAPLGRSETEIELTYDWSAVPEDVRQTGPRFPPFSPDHLHNSLNHLAELVLWEAD